MSDLFLLQSLHHVDEHRGMPLHARMIKVAYIAHATNLFQAQMLLEGSKHILLADRHAQLLRMLHVGNKQ